MQKLCFETQQPWEAEPEEWRPWESNQRRRLGMFYTKARPPGWKSETAASLDFVPSGTFFNVTLIDVKSTSPVPFKPPLYLLRDDASHHFQNESPSTRESSTFLPY